MADVEAAIEPCHVGKRPGVSALCRLCGYHCEATGRGPRLVRAALVGLSRGCPLGQRNWYRAEDGEDVRGLIAPARPLSRATP